MSKAVLPIALVVFLSGTLRIGSAQPLELEDAATLSREYLASDDREERAEIAAKLATYKGYIEPVLLQLQARTFNRVESGYHADKSFSIPELAEKHPDDLLFFNVPPSYSPKTPTGLVVFLHGGGATTGRRAPRVTLDYPPEGVSERDSNQLGNVLNAAGLIGVGASAPWNENSYYRWCLRESDEYIADVIRECRSRFNIDADRVILLGHSMGGFGAYHHLLRQPDRFSTVIVNAGSWSLGYWPAIRGTPLCIVQGVNDARPGARWHYTDVEYARQTVRLLQSYNLEHTYCEHEGMHALCEGKEFIAQYLNVAKNLRRDPFAPHIALATPQGFGHYYKSPARHNRWLSINETLPGTLKFDQLVTNGADDFHEWRLHHEVTERSGSLVEAAYQGNSIAITTRHIARFTVWLHPRMINVNKPVLITVNGKEAFHGYVRSSLLTSLESYERRGDWGLIYPIKVELSGR